MLSHLSLSVLQDVNNTSQQHCQGGQHEHMEHCGHTIAIDYRISRIVQCWQAGLPIGREPQFTLWTIQRQQVQPL